MAITLKICEDKKEWDSLLERCPHATVFHLWDFLQLMEKHSRVSLFGRKASAKLYPLMALDNEQVVGLFPVFFYPSRIIRYACSPANGSIFLGPVILDYYSLKQKRQESVSFEFQKAVDAFLSSVLKANLIRFNTPPNMPDERSFTWNGYSGKPLYTYEMDVTLPVETMLLGFSKKLRYSIRRCESEGVSVEIGNEKDLESLYSIIDGITFLRYSRLSTLIA
jgi:hypothetical protein